MGRLRELAEERNPFDDGGTYLKVCRYRVEASALGAALQQCGEVYRRAVVASG